MKPRISPDKIAQGAAYYQNHHTLREAAKVAGCNETTLAKYLRRMHLTRPVGSKKGGNTEPDPDNERAANVSLMAYNMERGLPLRTGITE